MHIVEQIAFLKNMKMSYINVYPCSQVYIYISQYLPISGISKFHEETSDAVHFQLPQSSHQHLTTMVTSNAPSNYLACVCK